MNTFEETKQVITLHGLGFIQVKLQGDQRLHIWHPDLPKRKCFFHSRIHDHRFSFISRVLIGTLKNIVYNKYYEEGKGDFVEYVHDGPRSKFGNRPWKPNGLISFQESYTQLIKAGGQYRMDKYCCHETVNLSHNDILVTLMRKIWVGDEPSKSYCTKGVRPDANFDRFQLSESEMWSIVSQALGGSCLSL